LADSFMKEMIHLEKALEVAGKHAIPLGTETVPLEGAQGRVLAEEVASDRDVPPFSRATMDGYACRREELPGPLEVLETIHAGKLPSRELGSGQCSRIMTGAMIPEGANCVIMQEYVNVLEEGRILFTASETEANIHPRAKDLRAGDLLLTPGTRLNPAQLGIIASTGLTRVRVSKKMNIGILATGSELVEAGHQPRGAQIRNSNSHQLAGQVRSAGHAPVDAGIVEDHREKLAEKISRALETVDLLLLTGGASVGELDLVPGVLQDLEFNTEFNRVAIQPGKPVSFAHRKGKACFGLSGNPVSSFVQFELLVRPYLELCTGEVSLHKRIPLTMEEGFQRRQADRQFFLPVTITGKGTCKPVLYHGSGHLHALNKAMGFAEIPAGQTVLEKGELVYVRLI
jgi:molybdopterin molybdotransferase